MNIRRARLGFVLLVFASSLLADEIQFSSGNLQTALIELYTSQGCSSCPPAEEYVNGYADKPRLWRDYVPVAFHVNYWDYLGWKDQFANPKHTNRQRRHAQLGHLRTVYTPAFVVNGKEWGPGLLGGEPNVERDEVGKLTVTLNDRQADVLFEPHATRPTELTLNLAVLGMNLSTHIRAGENRGRRSQHAFVVLGQTQQSSNDGRWQTTLPSIQETEATEFALAAWISVPGSLVPIQATGGRLPATLLVKATK